MTQDDVHLISQVLRLVVAAMTSANLLSGCRENHSAGQTINRTELATITKATDRAENLQAELESEFGGRGYTFRVGFSSSDNESNLLDQLGGGPDFLSVFGTTTFAEAIEFDRELQESFGEQKLAGLKISYEVRIQAMQDQLTMCPASTLAESAAMFEEIEKRQQGVASQSATRAESDSEGSHKRQPESEERSR